MPGTRLIPQFGSHALEWMAKGSVDFSRVTSDFVRNFYEVAGSVKKAGNLFMTLAARRGMKVGPVPLSTINTALSKIGGPGYGLVGEAVLDKFGVPRAHSNSRLVESIKSSVRTIIARQIDTSSIIGKV